jgi:hypothetical protein
MATMVKDIALAALKQLGRINSQGQVDENRQSKYLGLAPAFCNILQLELLQYENHDFTLDVTFPQLTALTDDVLVSDLTARNVMPIGLARDFARVDGDSNQFNIFAAQYSNAINLMSFDAPEIEDTYNMSGDWNLIGNSR